MTYHGHRRGTRTSQRRVTDKPLGQLFSRLRDQHVALRLLLCLLAVGGLVLSVDAYHTPFPYRLGQRIPQGVAARLDFERPNPVATSRARDDATAKIASIFKHDPEPLQQLKGQLETQLRQLQAAPTIDKVVPALWNEFGLGDVVANNKNATPRLASSMHAEKTALFDAVRTEAQVKQIVDQFDQFLKPVQRSGLLVSVSIPGVQLADLNVLQIRTKSGRVHIALLSEVQLQQLLSTTGLLGETWGAYSSLLSLQPMLEAWLLKHAPETLTYDEKATQDAREIARARVQPVVESFKLGTILVAPGALIDQDRLDLLREEFTAYDHKIPVWQHLVRVTVVAFALLLVIALNGFFIQNWERSLLRSASRLSVFLTVVVLTTSLGRVLSFDPWRAEVLPLIACVMIFAIAYGQFAATLVSVTLSLVLIFSSGGNLGQLVVLMSSSTVAILPLKEVSSRSTLIKVGLLSGATYAGMTWFVAVLRTQGIDLLWQDSELLMESLRGAAWCLAAGFLVAGSLPFIESTFGVVTNISLLELGDVSHPLLAELVRRAPGTYNHSITMASIAETAAESIGANGLLVKVGAYFHDIGKMLKPQYFVENMASGETSRHDQLVPAMSTLIIIGHVKDGVDLADQYNLPQPVIDFIEQHHGTTLVEFFYRAATRQADQHPELHGEVQESAFRYPGPKPQTKEAAVMMLADAVESASRTLSEPTPKRIERLVHDLAMKRLLDGQFEECGLTMTELNIVQDSLVKSLTAIYHGRIKYPEQRSA